MVHKGGVKALKGSLQDIRSCNRPIAGVTVLLADDFTQTLLVLPQDTSVDEVMVCLKLKLKFLWPTVEVLCLRVNMSARKRPLKAKGFSALISKISDDK